MFNSISPVAKAVHHTKAKYINLKFADATPTIITPHGNPNGWPNIAINSSQTGSIAPVVTSGILSLSTSGNRTERLFGNAAADTMMSLNTTTTGDYKCKFVAMKVVRNITGTPLASTERLFQYGDSGVLTGGTGGWVARIDATTYAVTFAMHAPQTDGLAKGSPGVNSPDITISSANITANDWTTVGKTIFMAFEYTVTGRSVHLFLNGVHVGTTSANEIGLQWPIPGASTVTPANDSASGGLVFFNQSINTYTANLKNATVTPIWIGEAKNFAHLTALAVKHNTDPLLNPYSS